MSSLAGGNGGDGNGQYNNSNNNNNHRPFTPPLWLTGEKQKERPRQWKVPLAASSVEVVQKVKRIISRNQRPYQQEQQSIHQATTKLTEYQQKCAAAEKKIQALEQAKEVSLQDIREQRAAETAAAVAVVEKKLRAEFEKESKERELEWKKGVEEDCKSKRKRVEEAAAAASEKQQESNKRLREDAAAKGATSEEGTTGSSAVPLLVSEKLQQSQAKTKEVEEELNESKRNVTLLNENRTEMIWLLKQAIKAEEKEKSTIKLASEKKPEAKIDTSPQA
jgi:chromosome segregation ATPase